jgi:hypothetical protein
MRIARRILITVAVTLTVVLIGIYWIAPVALSLYSSKKAPAITRVVPTDLKDRSVSQAVGANLSYLGYEFDVPWNDLNESKTELYPKDKPDKSMARLYFRSGLQLIVFTAPPHSMADQLTKTDFKMSPQAFAAVFGQPAAGSDYEFMKRVFEFSPDRMHPWAVSTTVASREEVLLLTKSIVPSKPAETGIFNVRNASYQGFQQGNPEVRPDTLLLDLYSANGGFEILFVQKNYANSHGVTQPEINRIVQSLRRAAPTEVANFGKLRIATR